MVTSSINKNKSIFLVVLFVILIPLIVYFYFLKYKTDTVYGDDLFMFKDYFRLDGFLQKIQLPVSSQKYRPIHGLSLYMLIESFQKNLEAYYLFNIGIQTINTILFAAIINLYLRSPYLSFLFSLIIGLSRFSLFNITQLLNGGALEGLALSFFLISLYFIIKILMNDEATAHHKQKGIILSILFANLSMYTHERYIFIFPFILLVIILFPGLKSLSLKQKLYLSTLTVLSVFLNVFIKKYVYSLPYFVGTGGTNIEFSFSGVISFFTDAVLSIFQINSGPEYLVGLPFSSLSQFAMAAVLILFSSFILILIFYIINVRKAFALNQKSRQNNFFIFIFLLALFVLALAPAIVTIRLEQRWLQAAFCIFILMIVIALTNIRFKNLVTRNILFTSFVLLFLCISNNYLKAGVRNLYMSDAENLASDFKQAIDSSLIRPATTKLYIWEKQKDSNTENTIRWVLGDGYIFDFYQGVPKKIVFADSIYQRNYSFPVSSFVNFNQHKDQILYAGPRVVDITNYYLRDSLKSMNDERLDMLVSAPKIQYNLKDLMISNDDFDKYAVTGFYQNENGIRWTNGNASISFLGEYIVKDTLTVELNTYMPPPCKLIKPKLSLVDEENKNYPPIFSNRVGDKFLYKFKVQQNIYLQKITIQSDTIDASPDIRTLSFPFIYLELKQF